MTLDKLQRLMLVNQYEILSRLDPSSKSDYEERLEILRSGYEVFYSDFTAGFCDPMSTSKSKFVLDVLDMYRAIEQFKNDNPKTTVFNGSVYSHFRGYDGNHETEYMGFVRFLIDVQQKYGEQIPYKDKTDNFNSHLPMIDNYRAMLAIWTAIQNNYSLTEKDVDEILKAP